MNHLALAGVAALLLSACSTTPTAPVSASTVRTHVAEGQLLCAAGPATIAMFSTTGAAILAKGATKQAVDTVCGLLGSVAVSPVGAPVASVTVALPPSLTIPLKG